MKRKAVLLAVMGIVLVVGTGVSLAAVLASDPAGTGAGSALATNGGPTGDRSVSPGGSDSEIRSSTSWLAASSDEPTEQDASYDREDEELLQANEDDRYDVGDQGQDDADMED